MSDPISEYIDQMILDNQREGMSEDIAKYGGIKEEQGNQFSLDLDDIQQDQVEWLFRMKAIFDGIRYSNIPFEKLLSENTSIYFTWNQSEIEEQFWASWDKNERFHAVHSLSEQDKLFSPKVSASGMIFNGNAGWERYGLINNNPAHGEFKEWQASYPLEEINKDNDLDQRR